MDFGFTTAAYVVAAVLFILSLGGLSGQESAKRAVWYGIVGMGLAVFATIIGPGSGLWLLSVVLIAGGGYIGYQVAHTCSDDRDATTGGRDALVGWSWQLFLWALSRILNWVVFWAWMQKRVNHWMVSRVCWPIKRVLRLASCG